MNLIRLTSKLTAVYPSSRVIATSWIGTHRTYTSKATEDLNKNGTNDTKAESNSQPVDAASTADKQPNTMEELNALESRMKNHIDSAMLQNATKLKELESRIEKIESRLNISRETRQVGELEQRFWVSVWILLLLFIIFKF